MQWWWKLLWAALSAGALMCLCGRASAQPCLVSANSWQSRPFPATGMYLNASFEAAPDGEVVNGVTGLSLGDASGTASLVAAVRFNQSGFLDVLDAEGFRSDARVRYEPGRTYRFTLIIDMVAHRYSATIAAPGEKPRVLAKDYSFPAWHRALHRLDRLSVHSAAGSHRVCGLRVDEVMNRPYAE